MGVGWGVRPAHPCGKIADIADIAVIGKPKPSATKGTEETLG